MLLFTLLPICFYIIDSVSSIKAIEDDAEVMEYIKYNFQNKSQANYLHIKYYTKGLNKTQLKNLYTSIQPLHFKTCVTFIRQNKTFNDAGFIFLNGTSNTVKINSTTNQTLIRFTDLCMTKLGCMRYHISLALGLVSQVRRPDREKYITVNLTNVDKDKRYMFNISQKLPIHKTNFDFGSLMNPDPFKLSKEKLGKAYTAKRVPLYDKMLGQRKDFTFSDLRIINNYYCKKVHTLKWICKNGGYLDPFFKSCNCPRGFEGRYCEKYKKNYNKCSFQDRVALTGSRSLSLKGKKECLYTIKAYRSSFKVKITIDKVNTTKVFPCTPEEGLEIRYNEDKGTTGLSLCGEYKNVSLPGKSNLVYVIYNGKEGESFKITYKSVKS
uniref:Metalloendopeptidase n=1 Tax=Parastrongyloides trichosuri TaxID=131310 RepID=A0A0N4ZDZ1_PARTI